MNSRIILIIIIGIIGSFFYLHARNPAAVKFIVTDEWTVVWPVTMLIFAGFLGGVVLMVLNSLFTDAKRAITDMRARRERKRVERSDEEFHAGVDAFLKGNIKKAIDLLKEALGNNPKNRELKLKLADAYMENGQAVEATEMLENHLLHNPDDLGILFELALCSEKTGDKARKEKFLKEILRLDSSNPRALMAARDMKIGEGDWEEAVKFQKAVSSSDRLGDGSVKEREKKILAGLLYESALGLLQSDNLDTAEARAKEALKTGAGFVPAYILMGELFLKRYNTAGAKKLWERAFHKTKNVVFILRLEDIYLGESNPDRILSIYRDAIESEPGSVNLKLLLARLYLRLEMVDSAISELEKMGDESEESFYGQILLAEAYLRRKQEKKAAMLFQKAIYPDRDLTPPFRCKVCGYMPREWLYRCPCCSEWNTFDMSILAAKESPAFIQSFLRATQ